MPTIKCKALTDDYYILKGYNKQKKKWNNLMKNLNDFSIKFFSPIK